jgi:hypothetical protein
MVVDLYFKDKKTKTENKTAFYFPMLSRHAAAMRLFH